MMQLLIRKVPDEVTPGIGIFLEGCRSLEDVIAAVNHRQLRRTFDQMPPQWPGIKQLCMRCLDKNMRTRAKAPTVLKDPWFGGAATASQKQTPIEQAMNPMHGLATVGIIQEMFDSTLATCVLSDAAMGMEGLAPVPLSQAPGRIAVAASNA